MQALFAALCLAYIGLAAADHACVCNYKPSLTVFSKDNAQSAPLGNLTGWGCKQILSMSVASQWYPIAFQHQVGFVQADSQVMMQMCVGDPPTDDKITSARTNPTTTAHSITATSPVSTTTTTRTTTTTLRTSTRHHPSTTMDMHANSLQTKLDGNNDLCPGNIAHEQSNYNARFFFTSGNIDLCPGNMSHEQSIYHDVIGQFGHKCYAMSLSNSYTWHHAKTICHAFDGTLVQIENQAEQAFLAAFVQRHTPERPVWLGLNDYRNEGVWHWSTGLGDNGYRNWIEGYYEKHLHHREEDCVVLMPSMQGKWDDIKCGGFIGVGAVGVDMGPTHNMMCQWFIPHTDALVG